MFFSKLFKNGSSQNAVYLYAIEITGKEELKDLIAHLEGYANEVLKADCVIEAKSDLKFGKVFDFKDKFRASFTLDFVMYCDSEKTTDKVLNTFNSIESVYGGIISLKKATKGIFKVQSAVVESLLEKGLPVASDDVAILADFEVMQDFEVDGEFVSQGVAVFMIDVCKTTPMINASKEKNGDVYDITECDLEIDDLNDGDMVKGYIWSGSGYKKAEVFFKLDGVNIAPASKIDWDTLCKCWGIDKNACEDFVEFANSATSSVNAIIGLLTETEYYFACPKAEAMDYIELSDEDLEYVENGGNIEYCEGYHTSGGITTIGRGKNSYVIMPI